MLRKEYEVYFLDDYVDTFRTKRDAENFIKESLKFDEEEHNPYGVSRDNYEIEVVEIDE